MNATILARPVATGVIVLAFAAAATAQDVGDAAAGKAFVDRHCASCHAVDRDDASPLPIAPPLRSLAARYPLESLEESLAEGIVTGHPAMPQFQLEPGEIVDLLAWLDEVSR